MSTTTSSRKEPLLSAVDITTAGHVHSLETSAAAAVDTTTKPANGPKTCADEYFQDCLWPGLGLFGESYLLFSVGTLQPLWTVLFPACFAAYQQQDNKQDNDNNNIYYDNNNNNNNNDMTGADNTCRPWILQTLTYGVVLGVITGMLVVGQWAQWIGRRQGSIGTATLMTLGALGLQATSLWLVPESLINHYDNDEDGYRADSENDNPNMIAASLTAAEIMILSLSVSLFVFGIGVGGEYPLAASSASEQAMMATLQTTVAATGKLSHRSHDNHDSEGSTAQLLRDTLTHPLEVSRPSATLSPSSSLQITTKEQQHRGRRIQLVFSMQGMGIFCNSLIMTFLLVLYGQTTASKDEEYNHTALLHIWRWMYAFGLSVLTYVLVSRYWYLKESAVWQADKEQREEQQQQQLQTAQRKEANSLGNESSSAAVAASEESPSVVAPNANQVLSLTRTTSDVNLVPSATASAELVSPPSDVSSLSAPSVIGPIEFDEHAVGGPYLSLKEEPSGADLTQDTQLPVGILLLKHFGVRLWGVSLCWFLWDVAFYGNKLFQSSFLLVLTGQEKDNGGDGDETAVSLVSFSLAASLNAGVALLGYFGAALLVDHPSIGRQRLQQWGLFLTGILFVATGFLYRYLPSAALVLMYLGCSFFGQLGPNATTFVLPAEVFPTQVRTSCHGLAAAAGKLGALLAALVFPHVHSNLDLFLISGYASLAASVVTFWTIPETTGLDLFELDRKWHLIRAGRRAEYQGAANHPRFLSYYERRRMQHANNKVQPTTDFHHNHAMDDF